MPIFLSRSLEHEFEIWWEPPADVYSTPSGWTIKVELAGVKPNDIEIEVRGSKVRVSGIRRDCMVKDGWQHHSMEISYCRFQKDVELPTCDCEAQISTEYDSGMLLVHVARKGNRL